MKISKGGTVLGRISYYFLQISKNQLKLRVLARGLTRRWFGLFAGFFLSFLAAFSPISYGAELLSQGDSSEAASIEHEQKTLLVDQLLERSGLAVQMALFPTKIKMGMNNAHSVSPYPMPNNEYEAIVETTLGAYNEQRLLGDIRGYIFEHLSEKEMISILAWLNSPLGQKITQLEEESASPEAYNDMQRMAHRLYANHERMEVIKALNKEVGATEVAVDMSENTQIAMMSSVNRVMNLGDPTSVEELARVVEANRIRVRPMIEQQMILSLLYSYRELTNHELQQYIHFARSPEAHHYHRVINDAISKAINHANKNCSEAITRLLNDGMRPLT